MPSARRCTSGRPSTSPSSRCAARSSLPPAAPLLLLGVARVVGWIAHGLEQYQEGRAIRPRARYAGALPRARATTAATGRVPSGRRADLEAVLLAGQHRPHDHLDRPAEPGCPSRINTLSVVIAAHAPTMGDVPRDLRRTDERTRRRLHRHVEHSPSAAADACCCGPRKIHIASAAPHSGQTACTPPARDRLRRSVHALPRRAHGRQYRDGGAPESGRVGERRSVSRREGPCSWHGTSTI